MRGGGRQEQGGRNKSKKGIMRKNVRNDRQVDEYIEIDKWVDR